jgi:hypothetical protein
VGQPPPPDGLEAGHVLSMPDAAPGRRVCQHHQLATLEDETNDPRAAASLPDHRLHCRPPMMTSASAVPCSRLIAVLPEMGCQGAARARCLKAFKQGRSQPRRDIAMTSSDDSNPAKQPTLTK